MDEIEKFITLVEKLANVENIYVDIDSHQNAYDIEYNRRIAEAFQQAKMSIEVLKTFTKEN